MSFKAVINFAPTCTPCLLSPLALTRETVRVVPRPVELVVGEAAGNEDFRG